MIDSLRQIYSLRIYEEVVGPFLELKEDQGSIIARIGKLSVILPECMKETLKIHLCQRIAILRTDLPDKPYLIRVLDSKCDKVITVSTGATVREVLL
jgi:hypothetical protein